MANMEIEREFRWDDTIKNDSTFELVPDGEYDFEIKGFERGRHNGSDKMPACPKATVLIRVDNGKNATTLRHNLFLHSKTEGLLCAYFAACGMRKKGEPLRMNFEGSVGRRGKCVVGTRNWTGNNKQAMQSNEIEKFIMPAGYDPDAQPAATPAAAYQAGDF